MKSLLELYALCVCFASVICVVVATGIAGYGVFKVAIPEITMSSYKFEIYQNNDKYFATICCNNSPEKKTRPPESELTNLRQQALNYDIASERRNGFQNIISCLMFILTGGIAGLIHWKIARKARIS